MNAKDRFMQSFEFQWASLSSSVAQELRMLIDRGSIKTESQLETACEQRIHSFMAEHTVLPASEYLYKWELIHMVKRGLRREGKRPLFRVL